MRCLRRRLSDVAYRQLLADAEAATKIAGAGPGGHSAASTKSSGTDLTPDVGSSDKPLPEPASGTLPAHPAASQTTVSGNSRQPRRRRRCQRGAPHRTNVVYTDKHRRTLTGFPETVS
jgi:transposase